MTRPSSAGHQPSEVTALDRIKQAAEESEGRYRDLVENSLGLICIHALDGTLLSVNGAAARSLSYDPSELVGRNLAEVLAPEARPLLQDYLQHIRREGVATGIMRTVAKTGEARFWSYRNVLREPPGQEPYVLGHAMDVTEQRRTEVALREAKELLEQRVVERTAELSAAVGRFRRILDRAPDAMLLIEPDGTISLVNRRTEEYFGYDANELIGKRIEMLVPKPSRKKHVRHRRAYTADPKVICNRDPEVRALRKDGTEFPVEVNLVPLDEAEGTPTMCTVRDLTTVRQWEAAVVESEQQMRLMADSLPAFVAYVDKDQRYQFVNQVYEEWHGLSESQVVGCKVKEVVGEDLYATIKPRIKQALAGHTVSFQSEGSYPDGRKRHTDATFVPRFDAVGDVIGFFSLVRDITSEVRAEEDARRSWEEMIHVSRASTMGELAASLAHELNQPLAAILSNSQAAIRFLDRETPDAAEARDALGDIADDARRAGDVIHRIRKLLRKGAMERLAVDINKVVEDVNCLLHSDTVARDITVTLDLAEGLPPVWGDAAQLQQVTLNLMMNACQAMSEQQADQRALVVRTARENGSTVVVSVEDTGPGVDPALGDEIFEPFVTSRPIGMGMGLSICRSIVEAHGGRLGTTPNPEGGSTFRFVLPVAGD
ncbi:MAG: PAS domain S-box protein [Gemmatimonadetes bacterium]|nr:PAS domain S-box protein [Gemmatimonadota bacterium]